MVVVECPSRWSHQVARDQGCEEQRVRAEERGEGDDREVSAERDQPLGVAGFGGLDEALCAEPGSGAKEGDGEAADAKEERGERRGHAMSDAPDVLVGLDRSASDRLAGFGEHSLNRETGDVLILSWKASVANGAESDQQRTHAERDEGAQARGPSEARKTMAGRAVKETSRDC